MHDFAYHKPSTIAAAVALLADPEMRPISGGQTLLPALKHRLDRPTALVDLSGIAELRGVTRQGEEVVIGAMTRHHQVNTDPVITGAIPALGRMAGILGDTQVRNRGTMGGALANNDPAADYPAAALALGATLVTDRRRIAADDYFLGMFTTALEPGELLVSIRFPIPEKAGYAKMRNPASRYVMAGVFVARGPAGVRVVVNGAGPAVFRQREMEAALAADWSPAAVSAIRQSPDEMNGDIHGGPEYRAHLVSVMAGRAVADAG